MTARAPFGPWVPWFVFIVFSASMTAGTVYVAESVRARDQLRFQNVTQDFRAALQARIDTHVALLRSASALFAATETINRAQFRLFIEHLELASRFPGIQGIGFAAALPAGGIAALEAAVRAEGPSGFRVWPLEPRRDFYTSIVFLEPLDARNEAALGYDMFSEPTRRDAMERARDTGEPVASGKVTLKQELDPEHAQAGFLIYVPVYRNGIEPPTVVERVDGLEGYVYAPFRAGDLLGSLLRGENARMLVVRIYDGQAVVQDSLLYDSAPGEELPAVRFRSTTALRIEGRPWTIAVFARPEFGGTSPFLVPTIFLAGLGIAILLFALTRAEARARASAEAAADALRHSEEELRIANRAKDEFLATLSHELRTPLNAILGWTRMLRMGHLAEARRENALAVIERNARVQVQLIEDLLDVSRIITGKLRLDLRVVLLNPALEQAVNTVRPAAEAKGVTLAWTPEPSAGTIYAAPDRLQQIVWNLLSNAIKFTPAGGRVELSTTRTPGEVRIVVRDTGTGIAPSFLPHVFERFRQADSTTTRAHSGVGLGLAIVRHLVELHGGTIDAASEGVGRGATFTVSLPAQRTAPAPLAASATPAVEGADDAAGRLSSVRVLVVDDQADARDLVRDALLHEGAAVQTAASVDEAFAALQHATFDVVVTDLAMPGADGFDLMRRLRQGRSWRSDTLPVIALTAYARETDRDRAMSEGFQGFLGKPVELQELIAMVAHLVGRA